MSGQTGSGEMRNPRLRNTAMGPVVSGVFDGDAVAHWVEQIEQIAERRLCARL